ncbi:hypothetical protein TM1040_1657 [Ruegeria sp. TM1040]|uniref:tail tape measure protein n=1 Tax=Ruegeria sp. (strain TM1040) TaxID=292414 RepID=UPI0000462373|nr:tail tape measure protein [Ruegeria sp. TM1040]ABF64390.1 hypothetical protein TM1040_1657 [Ruegeria sp. TM1040]
MSAIPVGALRAEASLETASFEAGSARARKALGYLRTGFEETSRDALRHAEGMARSWDDGFKKAASAAQKQIDALTGVERASNSASASAKLWAGQLDRQAKSFDRLRSTLDPVYASSKRYEAAVEQAENAVRSGLVTQQEANRVLQLAEQRYLGTSSAADKASTPTRGFLGLFSKERSHDLRQIGLQLSQVGQQGSVTGDYLGAAAIQAADIGAMFGIAGIAAGTLISVLGPMAVGLLEVGDASREMEEQSRLNSEAMGELVGALDDYTLYADAARRGTLELIEEFGIFAEDVKETYEYLSGVSIKRALDGLQTENFDLFANLSDAASAISAMEDALAALERNKSIGATSEQIQTFKENFEALEEDAYVAAQAVGLMPEEIRAIKAGFDELRGAQALEDIQRESKEALDIIREFYPEGQKLPSALTDAVVQLEAIITASSRAVSDTEEATSQTIRWADAMMGVNSEIQAIMSSLSAIGGGMLSNAAKFVEIEALQAGKSIKAARQEAELFNRETDWNARSQGANVFELMAIEAERWVFRSGQAADIMLDKEREAARERERALNKVSSASGKSTKALENELKALKASLDPMEAYRQELEKLAKFQGILSEDEMARAMRDLNVELADSLPLVGDLTDGLVDGLFNGFTDGLDGILDTFENWLKQMISVALKNEIVVPFMAAFSGGGAVAGGVAQAAAGGGSGLLGNVLGLGSGGAFSGAVSGISSGLGGVLSGGGLGSSFANLGGLVTGSVGGWGAVGAALPALGAVAAAVSFFTTKTKHLDNGLRVTADNMGTLVEEFDKVQKSRFWGLSKKVSLTFEEADEATAAPIRKSIEDITTSIGAAGAQLGLTADNFSSWSTQIQVSLKGLDEAARNAEIQRIFDTVADQFSYAALGSFNEAMGGRLIREGEDAAATLDALVSSITSANQAMELLNGAMFETSVYGADMARQLIDAAGGLDTFNASVNSYFTNFYSQEEQLTSRTGLLADQFEALNVAMPATKEAFRDLVEAQDLSTEEGRVLYAGLLNLSGEFANLSQLSEELYGSASLAASGISALVRSFSSDVLGAEDELADAQATALVEYNNVMRIMDLQIRSAQSARDSIKGIFDILSDGLGARTPLELEAQRLQRERLKTELSAGIDDPQRLREVVQGLNAPAEQFFSTYADFAYDYARTSALMDEQKGIAEEQLTEAEQQLRVLENQKRAIEELYGPLLGIDQNTDNLEEAMERLETAMLGVEAAMLRVEDSMYALAQALLSAVSGIGGTGGLMGLGRDAFDQFSFDRTNGILSEKGAGVLDGVAAQINGLYQDVFGRNVDVSGLDFYGDLLQSGQVKAGRIQYDLMTSGEAQTGVTPGFGNIGSAAQPVDPVEALYGSMLGRAADPAGVEFWKSTGLQGEALINAFRDGALAAGDTPSFDGGGYTGSGPRVGGIDGKGGFLAMLHPRETVIDHTRTNRSGGQAEGDSSAVVQELRKIGERLAVLESHARATTYNTGKAMRTQTKWDRDGVPKERTE